MKIRSIGRAMISVAFVLASLAFFMGATRSPKASAVEGAASVAASTSSFTSTPATVTKSVSRTEVTGGSSQTVANNTVTLHVSQTTELQGRQEISVSWFGAHPTGGIVANDNSASAQFQEFPFVILECRGSTMTTGSGTNLVSPQTCWTQSWTERYQSSIGDRYPPYTLDQYSTTRGAARVGEPTPLPATCDADATAPVQYWVPWLAADGESYAGGIEGCGGQPPEASQAGTGALPSNETFGATGIGGTGKADFDVFSTAQNAALGCTQSVACSLVAVPIMGISCNPTGISPAPSPTQVSQCESNGVDAPGSLAPANLVPGDLTDISVTGSLWWSPSNWRNRITVPLTFAPSPNLCDLATSGSTNGILAYGSELLVQATTQWSPHFCTSGKNPFSFDQVQSPEPEARNLLAQGSIDAALTSDAQSGGYGKKVANAPVALSGFAISYAIDGSNGQPYTTLRLTPMLVAKLLTESYPGDLFMKQDDPALANNPLNITLDPQFQALNPGIAPITGSGPLSDAASEIMALSSDSDVMEALTSWIQSDPTAVKWLDGTPDAWGMVVNPSYKGISLPLDQWPLLSTFEPTAYYDADGGLLENCLFHDPQPYLPLIAAPLQTLGEISESMQFDKANSSTVCYQPKTGTTGTGEELTTAGRQVPGHRFMIGVTPLADTSRYLLQNASLETTSGTFVAPTTTSLTKAASLLKPNKKTGIWTFPLTEVTSKAADSGAYPGTMVVYTAIPTSGLTSVDATDFATFLRFVVTKGQTSGYGIGQLPPGYLPLTKANHLETLSAYTLAVAKAVAAQKGIVPPLIPGPNPKPKKNPPPPPKPKPKPRHQITPTPGVVNLVSPTPIFQPQLLAAPSHKAPAPTESQRSIGPVAMTSFQPTADATLWTGGSSISMSIELAMIALVLIPLAFLAGRRQGRW